MTYVTGYDPRTKRATIGNDFGAKVLKALGITDSFVTNVVIEIPVHGIVKVYVARNFDASEGREAELLQVMSEMAADVRVVPCERVAVGEKGIVNVDPAPTAEDVCKYQITKQAQLDRAFVGLDKY